MTIEIDRSFPSDLQSLVAAGKAWLQVHGQQAISLPLGKNPISKVQALTNSLTHHMRVHRPATRRASSGRTRKK